MNEQCGGPYRDHPTRHHLIENHIDAWNYSQSGAGGTIPTDPWGKTDDYPDLSMSALWFLVQQTPDDPHGAQRPSPLSEDPDERKEQLDVDGEMPGWMAEAIVKAMIETFEDHPHPKIYLGDAFQQQIDQGLLTSVVKDVTGHGLDRPFQELLDGIAPPPPFSVPKGFPLPWEVQTAYRFMITMYKLNFNGSWELQKPRVPDFVIVPPASDFTNLFQPPDFSGVNGDNPIEDVCDVFIALVEWIVKEIADAIKLAGDLIKMALSPGTYALRLGLYELAMKIWDVAMKTHDVMAHTGILIPHSEQRYENGELRIPNEIDLPLITLGGTIDGMFQQALSDAIDPLGHLDGNLGVVVSHSVRDPAHAVLPGAPIPRRQLPTRRLGVPPAVGLPGDQRVRGQRPELGSSDPDRDLRPEQERSDGAARRLPTDASRPLSRGHDAGPGLLPDRCWVRCRRSSPLRIGPDTVADRPAERGVHREGSGHGEPTRRPGAVLRVPDRPTHQPDRLRDAVQPRRGPSVRVPHVGLDPRGPDRDGRDGHQVPEARRAAGGRRRWAGALPSLGPRRLADAAALRRPAATTGHHSGGATRATRRTEASGDERSGGAS